MPYLFDIRLAYISSTLMFLSTFPSHIASATATSPVRPTTTTVRPATSATLISSASIPATSIQYSGKGIALLRINLY